MIYLNNGATSWPKPPAVLEAVQACLSGTPASQFRGGSSIMKKDVEVLCREKTGTAPWNQGNRENIFLHQGQQKA